ncbi:MULTISPECIES: hypothetical protein [unclassified Streptomyces]|uniref:hypothetical protein n=1 Tax=unclassified Streptomyces TaxID=2593676 RepID=UPI003443B242
MADSRDRSILRQVVGDVVARLGGNSHARLNAAFAELGMPAVPEEGSKSERMERSFAQVPGPDLPLVANRTLATGQGSPQQRVRIEDELWAESSPPEIPMRIRRELARFLDLTDMAPSESSFMALLNRFWVLGDELSPTLEAFFGSSGPSLRRRIEQHVGAALRHRAAPPSGPSRPPGCTAWPATSRRPCRGQ